MEFKRLCTVDEAKRKIEETFCMQVKCESIPIEEACNKIVGRNIVAQSNVPEFRRSSVDGYAVYAKDTFGCSEQFPSICTLKETVKMGQKSESKWEIPGDCVYVPTGGMIPEGMDAVVMIEYSTKMDDENILVNKAVSPGENVIETGDDIRKDEVILHKGKKITPYDIGVLSSLGVTHIEVAKKIRVGIISTGDEIIPVEEKLEEGKIRDINSNLLYTLVLEEDGIPIKFGIVKDDREEIEQVLRKAINECDMVLISGGSSVGERDYTYDIISNFENSKVLTKGIRVKPGKPTIIASVENKPVFGLPGHPLAVAMIFKVLVKHVMNQVKGVSELVVPIKGEMETNYHNSQGREEYVPVTIKKENSKIKVTPIYAKSSIISAFVKAWGYIKISKNDEGVLQGQEVEIFKL